MNSAQMLVLAILASMPMAVQAIDVELSFFPMETPSPDNPMSGLGETIFATLGTGPSQTADILLFRDLDYSVAASAYAGNYEWIDQTSGGLRETGGVAIFLDGATPPAQGRSSVVGVAPAPNLNTSGSLGAGPLADASGTASYDSFEDGQPFSFTLQSSSGSWNGTAILRYSGGTTATLADWTLTNGTITLTAAPVTLVQVGTAWTGVFLAENVEGPPLERAYGLVLGEGDTLPPLWSSTVDLGDGWRFSPWFGFFNLSIARDDGRGWLFNDEHGWIYAVGPSEALLYFWQESLGWLFTNSSDYPSIYRLEGAADAGWYFYITGSGAQGQDRDVYHYSTSRWLVWSE